MHQRTPAVIVGLFIPIAVAFVPGFHDALAEAGGAEVLTAAVGTLAALVTHYVGKHQDPTPKQNN